MMNEENVGASILIADDDDDQRSLVATGVRRMGYDVIEANDGVSALAVLRERRVRVAILDWEMSGMSGPDVCREVRAMPSSSYVYLILLTVRADVDDLRTGLAVGADDYLVKPCHPAELQARVETGLRVIRDNDQLMSVIDDLTAANELLAAFSRTLAHDLRGTITSIAGFSYLLERDDSLGADAVDMVQQITEATRRMTHMVDDVLVLETAKRRPERVIFDVRQVIIDAAADAEGVEVVMDHIPGQLIAHRTSVARSFKNLFENASRYARRPDHDHVTVYVDVKEDVDAWTFVVEDDGPGIPLGERDRLFGAFERGSNAEGMRGTGLGLSIVAACARAHEGEVAVTNGSRGGAQFTLTLKKPS